MANEINIDELRLNNSFDLDALNSILRDIKALSYTNLYNIQKELTGIDRFDIDIGSYNKESDHRFTYNIPNDYITVGKRIDFRRSKFYKTDVSYDNIIKNPDVFIRMPLLFINGKFYTNYSIQFNEEHTTLVFKIYNGLINDKTNKPITDGFSVKDIENWIATEAKMTLLVMPICYIQHNYNLTIGNIKNSITNPNNPGLALQNNGFYGENTVKHKNTFFTLMTDDDNRMYQYRFIQTSVNKNRLYFTQENINTFTNTKVRLKLMHMLSTYYKMITVKKNKKFFEIPIRDLPVPAENLIPFRKTTDGSLYYDHTCKIKVYYPNIYEVQKDHNDDVVLFCHYFDDTKTIGSQYKNELDLYYRFTDNILNKYENGSIPTTIKNYQPTDIDYSIEDFMKSDYYPDGEIEYKLEKFKELIQKDGEVYKKYLDIITKDEVSNTVYIDASDIDIEDRIRLDNHEELTDTSKHEEFDEPHVLFIVKNENTGDNVDIFVDNYHVHPKNYAEDRYKYIYIPERLITEDSIIEINRYYDTLFRTKVNYSNLGDYTYVHVPKEKNVGLNDLYLTYKDNRGNELYIPQEYYDFYASAGGKFVKLDRNAFSQVEHLYIKIKEPDEIDQIKAEAQEIYLNEVNSPDNVVSPIKKNRARANIIAGNTDEDITPLSEINYNEDTNTLVSFKEPPIYPTDATFVEPTVTNDTVGELQIEYCSNVSDINSFYYPYTYDADFDKSQYLYTNAFTTDTPNLDISWADGVGTIVIHGTTDTDRLERTFSGLGCGVGYIYLKFTEIRTDIQSYSINDSVKTTYSTSEGFRIMIWNIKDGLIENPNMTLYLWNGTECIGKRTFKIVYSAGIENVITNSSIPTRLIYTGEPIEGLTIGIEKKYYERDEYSSTITTFIINLSGNLISENITSETLSFDLVSTNTIHIANNNPIENIDDYYGKINLPLGVFFHNEQYNTYLKNPNVNYEIIGSNEAQRKESDGGYGLFNVIVNMDELTIDGETEEVPVYEEKVISSDTIPFTVFDEIYTPDNDPVIEDIDPTLNTTMLVDPTLSDNIIKYIFGETSYTTDTQDDTTTISITNDAVIDPNLVSNVYLGMGSGAAVLRMTIMLDENTSITSYSIDNGATLIPVGDTAPIVSFKFWDVYKGFSRGRVLTICGYDNENTLIAIHKVNITFSNPDATYGYIQNIIQFDYIVNSLIANLPDTINISLDYELKPVEYQNKNIFARHMTYNITGTIEHSEIQYTPLRLINGAPIDNLTDENIVVAFSLKEPCTFADESIFDMYISGIAMNVYGIFEKNADTKIYSKRVIDNITVPFTSTFSDTGIPYDTEITSFPVFVTINTDGLEILNAPEPPKEPDPPTPPDPLEPPEPPQDPDPNDPDFEFPSDYLGKEVYLCVSKIFFNGNTVGENNFHFAYNIKEDMNTFGVYKDGRLIPPANLDPIWHPSIKGVHDIYAYTRLEDTTQFDWVHYPTHQILTYRQQSISDNGLVNLEGKISRPIDLKWYNIYLNGLKLNHTNIDILTPYTFIVKGVETVQVLSIYQKFLDEDVFLTKKDDDGNIITSGGTSPGDKILEEIPGIENEITKDLPTITDDLQLIDDKNVSIIIAFLDDYMTTVDLINPDIDQLDDNDKRMYPAMFGDIPDIFFNSDIVIEYDISDVILDPDQQFKIKSINEGE